MRPLLVVAVIASAAMACGPVHARSSGSTRTNPPPRPHLDFGALGNFAAPVPGDNGDADVMLNKPSLPPPAIERSVLPNVHVGPFHATLGGLSTGEGRSGAQEADSRDFLNSSERGAAEHRGARLTLTLHTR